MVEEVTEPNILYDIENQLYGFGVYLKEELDRFSTIYFKPKGEKIYQDRAVLNYLIDLAVERYKKLGDKGKTVLQQFRYEVYKALLIHIADYAP
ncbi:MAG: hypothetical protein ACOYBM_01405 [Dethiobacteria bacterium]|jgi:type I restriction enzyme R subunit